MPSQSEKAARFAALHDRDCFVLPNVWDFASAGMLIDEGYDVIATSSAGVAFAQGFPDGEFIGRDRMIDFAGRLAKRFDVPITVDLEAGYGSAPDDAQRFGPPLALGLSDVTLKIVSPARRPCLIVTWLLPVLPQG